ncbi:MAG: SDR family oxidoreductase [Alphaproteobacteria bacterium]|nr:SDR family oxidoreductase [Alphaproteobacteria bacterium]
MTQQPKNALVTGGSRRIGRAIASALAADGFGVCIHHNASGEEAAALAAEINAQGGRAAAIEVDLMDEAATGDLIARAGAALGPLDLLINNASVFERDEADTVTRESWDRHMEVNLRAPFVLIQRFAATLAPEIEGNVINVLDQRVRHLTPHFTSYTLSKAGLWTLTRTLALALAPRIRVNGVGPGPVLPSPRQSEAAFQRQAGATPLGRAVDPADIAQAVRYLVGARSVTGQMIAVDSGQHLQWGAQGPADAEE